MLHSRKDLPRKLWAETVNTATYIINRTGPTKSGTEMPYELWFRKSISIDHFKIFGMNVMHRFQNKRDKNLILKLKKASSWLLW